MDNSSSSRTATTTARRRSGRFSLGSLQKATISLTTRWWRKQSITTRRPSHQNDELAESTGSGNSSPRRPSQDQRTNSGREESTSPGGSRPSFLRGHRHHRFPGTRKAQEDAFLEFLDQNDHSIFLQLQQDQQAQQNSNEDHH